MQRLEPLKTVRTCRTARTNWLRAAAVACLTSVWWTVLGGQPATARSYYVSPDGSDTNDGSVERPVRTISRGVELLQPGDTLWIAGGVYRETVHLTRSGQPGRPIRILALPGEEVVLSGTEPFTGQWRLHDEHVYQAHWDAAPSQLFFDGQPLVEARWPNQPWDARWEPRTWASQGEGSRVGLVVDPKLASTGVDWSGGLVTVCLDGERAVLRVVHGHYAGSDRFVYETDFMPEGSASSSGHEHPGHGGSPLKTVSSERTGEPPERPGSTDRYFLWGKLDALDSPGEWFFDRKTHTVYLWPPAEKPPAASRVEGRVRDYGLVARNVQHVQIRGLRFFACTFLLEDVSDFVVEGCRLEFPTHFRLAPSLEQVRELPTAVREAAERYLGGLGVVAPTWVSGQRNVVRDCEVAFSEGPALCVVGSQNRVENCRFHDVDWRGLGSGVVGSSSGVWLSQSQLTVFRRNSLWNVGSADGVTLLSTGACLCELNDVHDGGLVLPAGALIQCRVTTTATARTTVRYNWVHDGAGVGIHTDACADGTLVHHNVVWSCSRAGLVVEGNHNQVYNNTCFDNAGPDLVLVLGLGGAEPVPSAAASRQPRPSAARTRAFNNLARVATVARAGAADRPEGAEPPPAELSNNLAPQSSKRPEAQAPTTSSVKSWLVRPEWFDFRPRPDSPLVDAGRMVKDLVEQYVGGGPDVGAYEWGEAGYWIPGARAVAASRPIPPDGATGVRADRELIWLGGAGATAFRVYVGSSRHAVAVANVRSREFKGARKTNRFPLQGLRLPPTVYWRVDTLVGRRLVPGPVWRFQLARPEARTTNEN